MTTSPSPASHPPEPIFPPDEPVFQAPWEAQAFALVNHLAADGHYSWSEWTEYLVSELAAAEKETADVTTYYEHWLNACEKLLAAKGLLTQESIQHKLTELAAERETEHEH
jgi:nitrile hydratase accessory protein